MAIPVALIRSSFSSRPWRKLRAIRNRLNRKLLCTGTCAVFSANAETSAPGRENVVRIQQDGKAGNGHAGNFNA